MPGESDVEKVKVIKDLREPLTSGEAKTLLRRTRLAVHPDIVGTANGVDDKGRQAASHLLLLLNQIAESAQTDRWFGAHHPGEQILLAGVVGTGAADSEKNFVVAPELVRIGKTPATLLRAFDFFVNNNPSSESWEKVKAALMDGRKEQNPDSLIISQLEEEGRNACTFEDVGRIGRHAKEVLGGGQKLNTVLGFLSRVVEHLIERRITECSDFRELKVLTLELETFLNTADGTPFRRPMIMDVLDNGAFEVGKKMLARARSEDEIGEAMREINEYPFSFVDAYSGRFAETREDALAKFAILEKLRRARSVHGIEMVQRMADEFPFKSKQFSDQYRAQIRSFIERKRAILEYRAAVGWNDEDDVRGIDKIDSL